MNKLENPVEHTNATKPVYEKPSLEVLDSSETKAGIFFGNEADVNAQS